MTDYLPPVPGVVPSYARLKLTAKQLLLYDWAATPAPPFYPYLPSTRPYPFMGLGKFVAGRLHQMRSGKSYLTAHAAWDNPDADTSCPTCFEAHKPSNTPSCPAPCPPIRDLTFSKGSQTWPLRPKSGPTSKCSLPWLSLFTPLPQVSLLECPSLLPPSTLPRQTPCSPLPPHPPLALETSYRFIIFFIFSFGCFATLIGRIGGTG